MTTAEGIAQLQDKILKAEQFIARITATKARLEAELAKLRAQAASKPAAPSGAV